MAIEPVEELARRRTGEIFADRQSGDIANPARGKIAGSCVMAGMVLPPEDIGRQREDTDDPPKEVVQPAPFEIGAMPAIMLDYEEPDQEGGGRTNQGQRRPGPVREPPEQ